jgi:hypothetical protein
MQLRGRGPKRITRRDRRASLDEIKALTVSSPSEQREAYARLDALIRDHARHTTGVPAGALTSSEFRNAIARPEKFKQLDQIQTLLAECERAKYGRQPPDPERWSSLLLEAEQVLKV